MPPYYPYASCFFKALMTEYYTARPVDITIFDSLLSNPSCGGLIDSRSM